MNEQIQELTKSSGNQWGPFEFVYKYARHTKCSHCLKWCRIHPYPTFHISLEFGKRAGFRERHVLNHISNLFEDESSADIQFNVKDQKIFTHSTIIASTSPVLTDMLESKQFKKVKITDGTDPERTDHLKVINVADVDPATFKEMIRFMYFGNINKEDATVALKKEFFSTADMYQIETLKEEIAGHLRNNLTLETVVDYMLVGYSHAIPKLLEDSLQFAAKNRKRVWQTPDWKKLMGTHPDLFFLAGHRMINYAPKKGTPETESGAEEEDESRADEDYDSEA
jgi:hypothetical protein